MSRFEHLEFEPSQSRPNMPELRADNIPSHDEQYWVQQADVERRKGFHENALRYYSRALEHNRSCLTGWLGQVQMLIALGEYPEAELWSRKANEMFRNNPDLIASHAQALIRRKNFNAAQALCDAALKMESCSVYPWIVRGEYMLACKEPVEQHCFDKAKQLSSDWLVCLEIADIYLHYSRPTKALALLRQAVEKAPDNSHCWYRQGCCELDLGLVYPAQRSLTHCLELMPQHIEAKRRLEQARKKRWSPWAFIRRLFTRS